MSLSLPINRCRLCGASSYRAVIDRDATGAMRPTGLYRCCGCSVVFANSAAWRDGESQSWSGPAQDRPEPVSAGRSIGVPRAPDWRTYGTAPDSSTSG